LWQQRSQLENLDVQTRVVTFDSGFMAKAYVRDTGITWPLLLDPGQELYKAYAMKRGSRRDVYGLSSIGKYLQLIARGQLPGRPGRDWQQLGGDVLIDRKGVVRFHYVSEGPHDRPTVEQLLAPIRENHSKAGGNRLDNATM
jgi:alkyl hydroperoxide reductase subunit AhpC